MVRRNTMGKPFAVSLSLLVYRVQRSRAYGGQMEEWWWMVIGIAWEWKEAHGLYPFATVAILHVLFRRLYQLDPRLVDMPLGVGFL